MIRAGAVPPAGPDLNQNQFMSLLDDWMRSARLMPTSCSR